MRKQLLGDIKSHRLIVVKGILFALLALGAMFLNLLRDDLLTRTFSLTISIWAACRFYYFLFYVLEKHVNPKLRYTGIFDLIKKLRNLTGAND